MTVDDFTIDDILLGETVICGCCPGGTVDGQAAVGYIAHRV